MDSNKLKEMPEEMKIIKTKVPNVRISRHWQFGKWQAFIEEKFSVINNPLESSLGYTNNSKTFELFIFSEKDVRSYLTLDELLNLLKNV